MAATPPVIGIVGLGHVGQALADALAPSFGLLHSDPARTDGHSIALLARNCAVVFVCVPTPAAPNGAADLTIVEASVAQLAAAARAAGTEPLVVIRSTVPPGTTQALAQKHAPLGIVVSPEFMRQHAAAQDLAGATRIVVGLPVPAPAAQQLDALVPVWRALSPGAQVVTTDAATAELVKHATNAYLALKVTFSNQMADACGALGVDYDAFSRILALDPRIGASHLSVPGHDGRRGFGGPCLPKDLSALLAVAGPQLPLLDLVKHCNDRLRGKG